MKIRTLKSDLLLLITAIIWGFAFVAQRVGMEFVGPFTFNAVRFALGSLSLIPLIWMQEKLWPKYRGSETGIQASKVAGGGLILGIVLFTAASLQQVGLVYTSAGKAGFITGLYVVLVPLLWFFLGRKSDFGTWIGAILAAMGLFLLSVTEQFTITLGDFLEILGAVFWAGHVLLISWLSQRINPIRLSFMQFVVCSILSLLTAIYFEVISLQGIMNAAIPILYGGLGSVGIAYTLQVVAQREAHPAHAAILLSLESVFAALGGWIIINEVLSIRSLIGCGFMFSGMLASQFHIIMFKRK